MRLSANSLNDLPLDQAEAWLNSLSDEQAAALKYDWTFWARDNQLPPDVPYAVWLLLAGRGFGKALDVSTPIPTPDGWRTMGDLCAGDTVFDECGQPCRVIVAHDIQLNRECYAVRFSDGEEIVADGDHLWLTIDRRTRKALRRRNNRPSRKPQCQPRHGPRVRTTKEIAATLVDAGEVNHCIPCTAPLRLPHKDLPLDPYVLGAWLGDGSSSGAEITSEDTEVLDAIKAAGFQLVRYSQAGRASTYGFSEPGGSQHRCQVTGRMMAAKTGPRAVLRDLGLLANKHIPPAYLRTSEPQRTALLQGLLDTDGHCNNKTGSTEFCSANERLANDVCELARSLGYKAVVYTGRATLNGRDCGEKYRVCFTAHSDRPLFKIARKRAAQPKRGAQAERAYRRYVKSVDAVPSRPVRCITVDSPSRLYLAGRGMIPTHNTRTGAEWVRSIKDEVGRIALVAPTAADARDVMVEGESGILATSPPWDRPVYEPSKRRVTWDNGAQAALYSADEPDRLRGPQHGAAWSDEIAAWKYMQDAWDMLQFGLRLGQNVSQCVTTTPRPLKLIKDLLKRDDCVVTRGTTYDNLPNLAPTFRATVIAKYEGTRLGRQELNAEMLEDIPGALWNWASIERTRGKLPPHFDRVVVAVDPPVTSGPDADECGIIVAGVSGDRGYVIEDRSGAGMTPSQWAYRAVEAYHTHAADRLIAEVNQGGEMVESVIRQVAPSVSFKSTWAKKGKLTRAEPVAALYEQGRITHAEPFEILEEQMTNYTGEGKSPDRMDAMVYAFTELFGLHEPHHKTFVSKGRRF